MSEAEAEVEEPTNHEARNRVLQLVYSSTSASGSDNLVFIAVHVGCKRQSKTESVFHFHLCPLDFH